MGLPEPKIQLPTAFSGPVNSGASIDFAGKSSADTLGGYIRCKKGGVAEDIALTNSHVIKPVEITEDEQLKGFSKGPRASSITIVSPGLIDTERTLTMYAERIARRQEAIKNIEWKHEMGGENERYTQQLQNHQTQMKTTINEQTMIQTSNFDFGALLCSSGYTSVVGTNYVSDWALIDVHGNRFGLTSVCHLLAAFLRLASTLTLIWLPTPNRWNAGSYYAPTDSTLSTAISHLEVYDQVFKRGQSTDQAWGHYTGIKTDVNLGQGLQEAMAAVRSSDDVFLDNEDSGIFIFNVQGHLVGLGFAGPVDRNYGYFILVKYVFDEITRLSGWRVITPKMRSTA